MALTRVNNQALTNVTSAGLPSGSILQVKFGKTSNAFSHTVTTANQYADVTGLSLTITPISTNSTILLQYHLDQFSNSDMAGGYNFNSRILRTVGSTDTALADTEGSRVAGLSGGWKNHRISSWTSTTLGSAYLDEPSTTSQITYKVQVTSTYTSGGNTIYVNRIHNSDTDSNNFMRGASYISAMEIAG
ncbi:MAG: hypothetical protein ACPGF7_10680 [Pontibacterium sp.]